MTQEKKTNKTSKFKGKVKKASAKERKMIDEMLGASLSQYYTEVQTQKKNLGDYIYVRTIYRDVDGKILKKEVARELLKQGVPLKKEHRYYLKSDLAEFRLKKGQQIPKDILDEVFNYIKEEIRLYNSALGVAYAQDLSFEEAYELVQNVLRAYEEGEIDTEDVHNILSP